MYGHRRRRGWRGTSRERQTWQWGSHSWLRGVLLGFFAWPTVMLPTQSREAVQDALDFTLSTYSLVTTGISSWRRRAGPARSKAGRARRIHIEYISSPPPTPHICVVKSLAWLRKQDLNRGNTRSVLHSLSLLLVDLYFFLLRIALERLTKRIMPVLKLANLSVVSSTESKTGHLFYLAPFNCNKMRIYLSLNYQQIKEKKGNLRIKRNSKLIRERMQG